MTEDWLVKDHILFCSRAAIAVLLFLPSLLVINLQATAPHRVSPPALFVENRGQTHASVRYLSSGTGVPIFFTDRDVRLVLGRDGTRTAIALELIGARASRIEGRGRTGATVNYLRGDEPPLHVDAYREVIYRDAWPGIDALFREEGGKLTYEFLLRPGARVEDIRLRYAGVDRLSLDVAGNLTIATPVGALVDTAPLTFQGDERRRMTIHSRFVLNSALSSGSRSATTIAINRCSSTPRSCTRRYLAAGMD